MSAITAKARRKMKKYAVLTREPRCFLGSFDFSWEQRKLGDIADIVGGGTPSTGNQSYWDGDIDWYAPAEIADQIYANSSQKKITGLGYENSSAKMLPPGTVLFTSRAGIGKTAILTRKGCTNQGFQSIVPHRGELDSYFIFSRTEELKRYGELVGAGSTFVEVSGKQMAVMELMMPPTMREQQTIGGFFQQLDHLITLHQRKCVFLFSFFRACISMNFTASTFSWEQRKAKEICSIGTGKSNTQDQVDDGKYPFYIRSDVPVRSNKYLYDCEAVITIGDGNIGKVFHYVNGKFDLHQRCYKMTDFKDIWGKYFFYYFSTKFYDRAMKMTAKATVDSVRLEMISEMDIKKPPQISEQKQIAEFFANLDNLITLHQRKFEKLTNVKKSMLEKMFPQNGSSYPEIRFKGFTDPWEQRKAIDIADYSKGNGYSKGDLTDAGTPIILYGRLYTKYQFAISEVDTFAVPRNGAVYSQGNEVIVPASGETAEDIARASAVEKSGVLLGGDLNILRAFDFINPLFLALAISNGEPQKELAKKAQGKSVVHIHNTDIQEVTIAYPSRTEQDRIVSVFRQLDNLITLHQRKPFLMKWRTSDANRNQTNRLVL